MSQISCVVSWAGKRPDAVRMLSEAKLTFISTALWRTALPACIINAGDEIQNVFPSLGDRD